MQAKTLNEASGNLGIDPIVPACVLFCAARPACDEFSQQRSRLHQCCCTCQGGHERGPNELKTGTTGRQVKLLALIISEVGVSDVQDSRRNANHSLLERFRMRRHKGARENSVIIRQGLGDNTSI